ncbi:pilus assembly protein PilP [Seohaeicola saemankumensis]|nr:pilus assembly protein PilP [Seohaeicola saemankumensis]MCA0870234.1 pilus assembly protein PilP [Seohaeicola saemankumensis]
MNTVKQSGKTPANVAATATQKSALDTGSLTLIGVIGRAPDARALVRLPGGRIKEVRPGERLSQGQVLGIDEEGLILKSGGQARRVTLPGS